QLCYWARNGRLIRTAPSTYQLPLPKGLDNVNWALTSWHCLSDAECEERFGEPRLMRRPGMSPWTPPSPALISTLLGREKGPLCGEVIVGSPASLTPAQRLRVAFG
ncbi:hypothetical protein ACFU9X_15585, partial [Streptomyces atratus]|uniref:hypothetical protein n=1 Tax=Streptomyces atratus TaxID=1893 RepID=UPI00369A224C